MHLVLFDIDGTLLSAQESAWKIPNSETGDEVLMGEVDLMRDVIKDITNIGVDPYRHRPSGKTDAQVVFELFEGICISEEEVYDWIPKLLEEYLKRLSKIIKGPESTELKPGVHELLTALHGRKDILLSLLTGNCEGAARLKLATHDLEKYFNFRMGAFGDRAKHRDELPAIAVEKAKYHHGHHFLGKSVVVIGDTPSDVRCVKALGARVVAVATGSYSMETLQAEGPDFLFPNLSDTSKVISAILHP
jgi:phosphoglycolate phosphatase-like HAD superfamily hydrolase